MISRMKRVRWVLSAALVLCAAGLCPADFASQLDEHWSRQYEWLRRDCEAVALGKSTEVGAGEGPVGVLLHRTRALLDDIKDMPGAPPLKQEQQRLDSLEAQLKALRSGGSLAKTADEETLFRIAADLQRSIALSNPLLDFDAMIFNCYESKKPQFHSMQMAFFAKPDRGAGLYKVTGFKNSNPRFADLLEDAAVTNGRFKGETLSNKNSKWNGQATFFSPEVNYEADKIAFAWAEVAGNRQHHEIKFHLKTKHRIFELDLHTNTLRMLSDFGTNSEGGTYGPNMDEYDPTYLPSGRMMFVSERHNGGQRCGNTATSGNLYTAKPTGGPDNMMWDIVRISWHETNERSPVVDNDGMIIYSRWDYIDRHAYSAQSMWIVRPDGCDPRAWHGNYIEDDKPFHPIAECDIRPIPYTHGKYMGIASGHHESYWGPIIVIDINKRAKHQEQISWFVSGSSLPGDHYGNSRYLFATPWPLSEDYVIASRGNDVLLVDAHGNETLLFSNSGFCNLDVRSAQPLKARTPPPVIPVKTYQGERRHLPDVPKAVISVMDVYQTDTPWPSHIKIKKLRICQLVPRPKKPWDTWRNLYWGWSDGALLKAVVGDVPVESDGSAYFEAPIEREIFFQAVDSTGMAVTSMLSGTYVHPGEHLTCVGCHEDKWVTPQVSGNPTALQRAPSTIEPDVHGSYPLNYHALVRIPVLERKCAPCHEQKGVNLSCDYWNENAGCKNNAGIGSGPGVGDLEKFVKYYGAAYENAYCYTEANQYFLGKPGSGRSRSIPMQIGARDCPLLDYLYPSHTGSGQYKLTQEQFHRVTLWMDLNCQELGTYQYNDDTDVSETYHFDVGSDFNGTGGPYWRQRQGELVWPSWEGSGFDPANPTGVQLDGVGVAEPPYEYAPLEAAAPIRMGVAIRNGYLMLYGVPRGRLDASLLTLSGRAVHRTSIRHTDAGTVMLGSVRDMAPGTYMARVRCNGSDLPMLNSRVLIAR